MSKHWRIVQVDVQRGRRPGRPRLVGTAGSEQEAQQVVASRAARQPRLRWKTRQYVIIAPAAPAPPDSIASALT